MYSSVVYVDCLILHFSSNVTIGVVTWGPCYEKLKHKSRPRTRLLQMSIPIVVAVKSNNRSDAFWVVLVKLRSLSLSTYKYCKQSSQPLCHPVRLWRRRRDLWRFGQRRSAFLEVSRRQAEIGAKHPCGSSSVVSLR
jgi:hypothetical protein